MAETTPETPPDRPQSRGIDRRTFVRRAMGTAAFGAIGAAGLGMAVPLSTSDGVRIPRFPYFGAKIVDGPAPKGIPIIPVRVDEEGFIQGVPSHLSWYRYCSHQGAPGLQDGFASDNKMYYFQNPTKIHDAEVAGIDLWYTGKLNQALKLSDFTEEGQGAPFKWRSEGQFDNNIVTGIAIRIDPSRIQGLAEAEELMGGPFMDQNIIAFCSFCAHFCCVPGFKESKDAESRGVWDMMFCTCHGSVYDPFDLTQYQFPPDK